MIDGLTLGLITAGVVGLAALVRAQHRRRAGPRSDVARGQARLAEAELYARAFDDSELELDRERALALLDEAVAALRRARDHSGYRDHNPAVHDAMRRAQDLQRGLAPPEVRSSADAPAEGALSSSDGSVGSPSDEGSGV